MSTAVVPQPDPAGTVEQARCCWLAASDQASALAAEMFQPGSGYGCPEAEAQDRHRLETARSEAERRFREYQDLERQYTQQQILQLQRSQQRATWASFCVAAAVGVATIVGVVIQVAK